MFGGSLYSDASSYMFHVNPAGDMSTLGHDHIDPKVRLSLAEPGSGHYNDGQRVRCGICERVFPNIVTLTLHNEFPCSKLKSFQCNTCDKTFKEKRYLKEHERVHSNANQIRCSQCDITFYSRASLWKHNKKFHAVQSTE